MPEKNSFENGTFNILILLDEIPEYLQQNNYNMHLCTLTKGELFKYA